MFINIARLDQLFFRRFWFAILLEKSNFGITKMRGYLYICSTQEIYGRWLCTRKHGAPVPAHRRHAVMARAGRYQTASGPISPRSWSEIRSTLICNQLSSGLTQCDLTCGVWINRTTGTLTRCRSESLLTCTVWINWTAQLCLVAEFDIQWLELIARGEHFVLHVVLCCVEQLIFFFRFNLMPWTYERSFELQRSESIFFLSL